MRRRTGVVLGSITVLLVAGGVQVSRTGDADRASDRPGVARTSDPSSPSASGQDPPSSDGTTMTGLLPNVRSLAARDLQIERSGGQRRLRFAALLANSGPGPLLVRPRRGTGACPAGQLQAVQLVHEDGDLSGAFERDADPVGGGLPSGCMLDHPGHDHWHFDAMAAYSLRRPGSLEPLVRRDKVSFCLRDNRRIPGHPGVVAREHFGECGRARVQGISPGWVDVYTADLDGQWLRVPRGVDDEVLCLDLEADPFDLLAESDESDNAVSVAVRVDGQRVRLAPAGLCR